MKQMKESMEVNLQEATADEEKAVAGFADLQASKISPLQVGMHNLCIDVFADLQRPRDQNWKRLCTIFASTSSLLRPKVSMCSSTNRKTLLE